MESWFLSGGLRVIHRVSEVSVFKNGCRAGVVVMHVNSLSVIPSYPYRTWMLAPGFLLLTISLLMPGKMAEDKLSALASAWPSRDH